VTLERIALLSDVHGNLTAYEAVLADIDRRGITRVINLGDVVGKGPRGSACTALTRQRCEATVRGNWEVFLSDGRDLSGFGAGPSWWREELSPDNRDWLLALPGSLDLRVSGRRVRLMHASPIDEFTRVPFHHTEEQRAMMFEPTLFTGDVPRADVYLEGHPEGTLVNVGSVGNPLDEPTASYVILEGDPEGDRTAPFSVQFVRIAYDVEAEISVAEQLGMPEADAWAIELRTAIYRGRHEKLGLR
jgi:protein phosphatase